jgi:uncharacterized membrane protein HdeD (DUF308 family)
MTILNSIDVLTGYTWGYSTLGLLLISTGCVLLILTLINMNNVSLQTLCSLILLAGIFSVVGACRFHSNPVYETQYQVTFDDSITISALYNSGYEIVDKTGSIYTIRTTD